MGIYETSVDAISADMMERTKDAARPTPMNTVPMMGTIQCAFPATDQPNLLLVNKHIDTIIYAETDQKSPIGVKSVHGIKGINRCSGLYTPLAEIRLYNRSATAPQASVPVQDPTPSPMNANPTVSLLNPYVSSKVSLIVVRNR